MKPSRLFLLTLWVFLPPLLFAEEQKVPVAPVPVKMDDEQQPPAKEQASSTAAPSTPTAPADVLLKKKVEKVTDEQDELQADAQDLAAEQTDQEVIEFIEECQKAMNDAIDNLEKYDTGSSTIAAQTDVIEKIYKAAQKKANGQGGSGMQGMLQMMQGMMGNSQSETNKDTKGKSGQQQGQGNEGKSDKPSNIVKGNESGVKEPRKLAKSTGDAGLTYPDEFAKAMNAYNKSMDALPVSPPAETKTP